MRLNFLLNPDSAKDSLLSHCIELRNRNGPLCRIKVEVRDKTKTPATKKRAANGNSNTPIFVFLSVASEDQIQHASQCTCKKPLRNTFKLHGHHL